MNFKVIPVYLKRKNFLSRRQVVPAYVDEIDYEMFRKYRWRVSNNRIPVSKIGGKVTYMHSLILKPRKGFQIRHRNKNSFDNRRSNLYIRKIDHTTLLRNKYMAQVTDKKTGKAKYLGIFKRKKDAQEKVSLFLKEAENLNTVAMRAMSWESFRFNGCPAISDR